MNTYEKHRGEGVLWLTRILKIEGSDPVGKDPVLPAPTLSGRSIASKSLATVLKLRI